MAYALKGNNYCINLAVSEHNACIEGGSFGEISLCKTVLFDMRIKRMSDGESISVGSMSNWANVTFAQYATTAEIYFAEPDGISDIGVLLCAKIEENGVKWSVEVTNDNCGMSVMEVKYPMPRVKGKDIDFFHRCSYFTVFKPQA